jgi:hypothetical protein
VRKLIAGLVVAGAVLVGAVGPAAAAPFADAAINQGTNNAHTRVPEANPAGPVKAHEHIPHPEA